MTAVALRSLGVSVLALSAAISWLFWLGSDAADTAADPLPSPAYAPVNRMARTVTGGTAFSAISDRPLFTSARRAWRPAAAPAPRADPAPEASPPARLEASLVGVVISPSRNAAILRLKDGNSAILGEGSILHGWTLKRVTAHGVVLSSPAAEEEIAFAPRHGPASPQLEIAAAPLTPLTPARRRAR